MRASLLQRGQRRFASPARLPVESGHRNRAHAGITYAREQRDSKRQKGKLDPCAALASALRGIARIPCPLP
jgi:hypothetical protein